MVKRFYRISIYTVRALQCDARAPIPLPACRRHVSSEWVDRLTDGTVDHMIYVTATGIPPNGMLFGLDQYDTIRAAIGCLLDPVLDSCSDWTDSRRSGWGGLLKENDAHWTVAGPANCDAEAHLYCFQQ